VDGAGGGERLTAVEDADVVEAEEAALEEIAVVDVLAVDPPGEVEHQLVEDALQESEVARVARIGRGAALAIDLKDAPGGPGVHGRIHLAEIPFLGRAPACGGAARPP